MKELTADAGRRCCLKVVNKQGATPLHLAAAAGHTGVAQHLMSVGAKLQARDKVSRQWSGSLSSCGHHIV